MPSFNMSKGQESSSPRVLDFGHALGPATVGTPKVPLASDRRPVATTTDGSNEAVDPTIVVELAFLPAVARLQSPVHVPAQGLQIPDPCAGARIAIPDPCAGARIAIPDPCAGAR